MNILIRKAERKDAAVIAHFNAAMAEETEHLKLDTARLLQGVNGLFDKTDYGFYLLAEINNEIAGQLMITYEWSDWRNGVFWWIQSVYVKPEFRAHGVFKSLYNYTVEQAKAAGNICGLRLYVEKENARAHHVYEKLGMKSTHYDMYEVDFVIMR